MSGKWSYDELEAFLKKIHDVMDEARETGNYTAVFEDLYTEDAIYSWGLGPTLPDFVATGKDEIMRIALGAEMGGVDGWKYPWSGYWIDEKQGVVAYRWEMVSPWKAPKGSTDGEYYKSDGYGYTFHYYAGNMKSKKQLDLCETQQLQYVHAEGIAAGLANEALTKKVEMRRQREAFAAEEWKDHLEEIRKKYETN